MTKYRAVLGAAFSVAAGLLATAVHSQTAISELSGSQPVRYRQDSVACSAQASLPWCMEGGLSSDSLSDTEAFKAAYQGIVRDFFLKRDEDGEDIWASHYGQLKPGRLWGDDCDGLTFTVLEGLYKAGVSKDHMWRLLVIPSELERKPDYSHQYASKVEMHMVGLALIGNVYYVVGDTARRDKTPYPLSQAQFSVYRYAIVSEGLIWRRASPLELASLGTQ